MPEGPEVTRITERVRELIKGKTVAKLETVFGKIKEKGLQNIQKELPLTVTDVKNNGKLMWIVFQNNSKEPKETEETKETKETKKKWWLFVTFGLVGGLYLSDHRSNRLRFTFSDDTVLYYRDSMNYGGLTFTKESNIAMKKIKERGFNLFGEEELHLEEFVKLLKKPRTDLNVCDFLSAKQKYLSGIGNYLKCEILYFAKLSPWKTIKKLTTKEVDLLHYYVVEICKRALNANGRTSNYTDLYKPNECTFEDHFMVYQKKEDPNGNKVTCEETPDKRKTYWCKAYQC